MKKILLTGGTGFLGKNILKELENPVYKEKLQIESIRLLVRNPAKAKDIKSELYDLEILEGDIIDPIAVRKAVAGVDAVIHVASKYSLKGKMEDFMSANVDGTRNIIEALKPGTVFILTSSTAVYGYNANKGKPFNEDFEPKNPFGNYQKSKKMQEDLARQLCKEKGIVFVAIRPPMILGPGDEPAKVLMGGLEEGRVILLRGGKGTIPVVHPRDAAKAHLLALEKASELNGESFHLASFHVRFKDYANAFSKELGLEPLKKKAPYSLVYFLAWLLDISPKEHDITRFTVKFLGSNTQLDVSNITEKLGFKPDYSLEQTVKETADWYKSLK